MTIDNIQDNLGKTDIYLIDQILKGRYQKGDKILDAGCGTGRNIQLFLNNGYSIYGIDHDKTAIESIIKNNSLASPTNFINGSIDCLDFNDNFFDHIICNAVLHFAENTIHFNKMFNELLRVLKPQGSLFIRMTSSFGIENKISLLNDGVYKIPDGTTRFLLTEDLLNNIKTKVSFIEPLKTVNVNNIRCMSNLILLKK